MSRAHYEQAMASHAFPLMPPGVERQVWLTASSVKPSAYVHINGDMCQRGLAKSRSLP